MYLPAQFEERDPRRLLALMRAHPFATLAAIDAGGALEIGHAPLLVEEVDGRFVITGHVARANPLWRARHVTCVFNGPHAYVSAAWYGERDTVPTWNHLAVQASGPLTPVEDPAALRDILERSGRAFDAERAGQWWATLSAEAIARLSQGIVGIRIAVASIVGKSKLSQHHPPERRRKAIAGLRAAADPGSLAVAAAMEATL